MFDTWGIQSLITFTFLCSLRSSHHHSTHKGTKQGKYFDSEILHGTTQRLTISMAFKELEEILNQRPSRQTSEQRETQHLPHRQQCYQTHLPHYSWTIFLTHCDSHSSNKKSNSERQILLDDGRSVWIKTRRSIQQFIVSKISTAIGN